MLGRGVWHHMCQRPSPMHVTICHKPTTLSTHSLLKNVMLLQRTRHLLRATHSRATLQRPLLATVLPASRSLVRSVAASSSPAKTMVATDKFVTTQNGTPPPLSDRPLYLFNWACPYVHRVTLALSHKKVSDRVGFVDIDLANKPSWLTQYSPLSKVPAVVYLEDGEPQVLIESLALIQWVEDYFGGQGPSLLPDTAAQRAKARVLISRFDSSVTSGFYKLLRAPNVEEGREVLATIHKELEWVESQIHSEGPFLLGPKPTLADAALAPWLLRIPAVKHWRKVDPLEGHPKLQRWLAFYRNHPDVQATFIKAPAGKTWEEGLVEAYGKYGATELDLSKAA